MIILITGGSGSGKSQYAEELTVSLGGERWYLATMFPFDKECEKKIEKHRKMRKEKDFDTIECYTGIQKLVFHKDSSVLLECMSNLVANEMYGENGVKENIADYIVEGITTLASQVKNLIVVSNEVFSDGISYEEETTRYLSYLGEINQRIGELSNKVIEVVYSIPVVHKSERKGENPE